ncbi:MAG: hypothetical protein CL679_03810 [Bermanella sp.]|nr:hypothetical protein [Bermanella sp.]
MDKYLDHTQAFIDEYLEKGGSTEEAEQVLQYLLELAVVMYRKGDIKHVQQAQKAELVCQLKKGSRRVTLTE